MSLADCIMYADSLNVEVRSVGNWKYAGTIDRNSEV